MKKINSAAILNLCRGRNYGGVLQAYALQEVVNGMEIKCSVVDFDHIKYFSSSQRKKNITLSESLLLSAIYYVRLQ
jgi:hypothetical protein